MNSTRRDIAMDWQDEILATVANPRNWGYRPGARASAEPVALASLALLAHGRKSAAESLLEWLDDQQQPDGSIGVTVANVAPCWPTGWAALAWRLAGARRNQRALGAVNYLLSVQGLPLARNDRGGAQHLAHRLELGARHAFLD